LDFTSYRYRQGVFTGSMGEIFETMRKLMNFTFTAIPSSDGFYGAKVSPSSVVNPDFGPPSDLNLFKQPDLDPDCL
jgi:hypothetical protein